MKVGGRDFDMSKEDVEQAMKGVLPEEFRKYVVEVNGEQYPPKQVLARATDWGRTSFTTMEAQRVLNKLGFKCREAGSPRADGSVPYFPYSGKPDSPLDIAPGTARAQAAEDRVEALEAALATAQTAIAGLDARVRALEAHD